MRLTTGSIDSSGSHAVRMPGRTVAMLGSVRDRIGATMLPPNAGLSCESRPSSSMSSPTQSPVSPISSLPATRAARSRPLAVDGTSTANGEWALIAVVSAAVCVSVSYSAKLASPATFTMSAPYAVNSRMRPSLSSPIRTASTLVPICTASSRARPRSSSVTGRTVPAITSAATQIAPCVPRSSLGPLATPPDRDDDLPSNTPRSSRNSMSWATASSVGTSRTTVPSLVDSRENISSTHVGEPSRPNCDMSSVRSTADSCSMGLEAASCICSRLG